MVRILLTYIIVVFGLVSIRAEIAIPKGSEVFHVQPNHSGFNVSLEDNQAVLRWNDLPNVKSILIERSTNNGSFEPISQLFKNSNQSSYVDDFSNQSIKSNRLLYRLLITYDDGSQELTDVQSVVLNKIFSIKPKVSVSGSNVNFQFQSSRDQMASIRIFNSTTGLVKEVEIEVSRGENNNTIQLNGAHSGLYFMQIEQSGRVATTKFFIQ